MKILNRYVFRELLGPFFLGLVVFSFVIIPRLRVLELLVQKNVAPQEVILILFYIMPTIFTFSLPMASLLAILISFGRLSADNEITAMRSSGVGIRSLVRPVLVFACLTFLAALFNANYWQPHSNQQLRAMHHEIALKSISTAIRPGVFEEGFSNLVLYIRDTTPDKSIWKGVFLADISKKDQPKITLAETGILFNDILEKKLQLHLSNGATHSVSNRTQGLYDLATFNQTDIPVASLSGSTQDVQTQTRKITEMDSMELRSRWRRGTGGSNADAQKEHREQIVELSKRVAIPFGVIVFSLLAVPLGVIAKKGGKSYGFVVSLGIFLVYFLLLSLGESFAKTGRLSPIFGPWAGNAVFLVLAIYLLAVSEKETGWSKLVLPVWKTAGVLAAKVRLRQAQPQTASAGQSLRGGVRWTLPLILDKYVIVGFLKYFLLVLGSFVIIFIVFTFFELLEDVVSNQIPVLVVLNYFYYLLPQIVFYMIPMSVLVAVLVNFGVLTRTSQIVAMKASGVSLYRLALSLVTITLLMSALSFAMQEYVLPGCNQKQDSLRDVIKGRQPQTYLRPDRKCMMGQRNKIFYYNFFDEHRNLFGDLSVFEFDPASFEIRRRIYATRASWDEVPGTWILEDGWSQGFREQRAVAKEFVRFERQRFPEIAEDPRYFKKEVKQSSQMSYLELRNYIEDLRQSGFDVVRLTVALHKKLSFPIISLIMCMIAIPFSFSMGKRGSLYGVGLSIMIGITYWVMLEFFEQMGGAGMLLPFLAAWAPNLIFGASGVYFLFMIRT
ncbi:MAG: LPS export ABC transporter permease LptF [Acidobacteria bacterium]|nr:LPS export ABC transporter permease LptF [Acidobacteriota bacterium]